MKGQTAAFRPFEFRPGQSLCHRLDPRAKLLLICILSISSAASGWAGTLLFSGLIAAALKRTGLPVLRLLRALRLFLLFLVVIILVQGLMVEGPSLISAAGITLTAPGLTRGSLTALRFLNIMILGAIFCAATRPSDLNAALQWVARPVPFIPEQRMGMIFSLALRFLPMIFHEADETRNAILARCGRLRKNPVRRIALPVLALTTRVFQAADNVATAMEARGYTDRRTPYPFSPCGREKAAILAGMSLSLTLIFL